MRIVAKNEDLRTPSLGLYPEYEGINWLVPMYFDAVLICLWKMDIQSSAVITIITAPHYMLWCGKVPI